MNKNLIKVLSLAGSVVMSVSLFAGCGQTSSSSTTETKDAVKMETITVWSNNASQKDQDEKMVADYNKGEGKTKGINIDYKIYGGDYNNVLKIAISAGEGPDIYKNIDSSYVKSGAAIPLEDLPGANDWLKSYKDSGLLLNNVSIFNGKVYSVPYIATTCAVAYNKDLLKKNGFNNPPKTWAELSDMARTITKNGAGKEFGYIEGLKSTGYVAWNGLWQGITGTGHNEWDPVTAKYDYSSFAPFLQIVSDLKKDGCWFPGVEGLNNDGARAQFAQGNIGFKLSGSWDVGVLTTQFPAKMDWGFCRPVMDEANAYKYIMKLEPSFSVGTKAK
ncbi:MAG: extracellular solute-binding protein [Clostridiaceae bacterium]|nr:extracellular solute-binding protein [Clostridiaceae bacterium]